MDIRMQSGHVSPDLVGRLVELGHVGEVALQAGRGEWFCARAWAGLLAEEGRRAEAEAVLARYVATGWWTAAETLAGLLERWGRAGEAIALVRPHADAGGRPALACLARLRARQGRTDAAFDLLSPHVEDWFLATALVDVCPDRDDDVAALLAAACPGTARRRGSPSCPACAGAGPCCDSPSCGGRGVGPANAVELLAGMRARQGRVDEAIAPLHTRDVTSVNNRDALADLLARHDRVGELRADATADFHGHGAQRLAELLEGAIAVYREATDSPDWYRKLPLAELLVRHGRGDEATDVLRSLADAPGGAEDWIAATVCMHYAEQGRAEDGLA